jgi:hypothetical protein
MRGGPITAPLGKRKTPFARMLPSVIGLLKR